MNPYPNPAVNAVSAAWGDSQRELLRREIRSALETWSVNPNVTINNVNVTEGDSGTLNATFTVSLSKASDLPVTVQWNSQAGTAVAGADYNADLFVGKNAMTGDDDNRFLHHLYFGVGVSIMFPTTVKRTP